MLDEYCERLGPGLWAEPVNALTNLVFILAALLLWRLLQQQYPQRRPLSLRWLIVLVASIGVGSGLYHTFATPWAMWMDVIPILIFQISLLWTYLRRLAGLGALVSSGLMMLFMAANYASGLVPDWLNGSMMYAPAIASVLLLGLDHARRQSCERWLLLGAFAVFCVSLFFRTLDNQWCEIWPLGTHFVWHVLNGLVLYLATRALITVRGAFQ
ncbi:ceramidase domain-containing protein [Parathalassolituus penaei]|uniref:Ceramidase domain-containing protein n=1 Tax=Parathalassolituus penaei TaxID=2997323 RepID=A0A9X3IR33_9GAMM|nr:ceramidase domain-containing protein [Parathalassolituus penaei]MCY0964807.1 ceramidase domain-containing protein [Parathalassolituus penaei]